MDSARILSDLERYHKITLHCETKDGQIFTTVKCPYWVRREHTFSMTHDADDFTEFEAKVDFIPKVLQMAGLKIEERLVHRYE